MFKIVHCADSFAAMKVTSDRKFDVIITDPPYPSEVQSNMCSGSLVGTKAVPKYELDFAPIDAHRAWILDGIRIAKRWCISFCALEDFGRFQDIAGKGYVRGCVQYKSNAMGQLTADRPASAFEGVACLHRTDLKKQWNGKGSCGIWKCNGTRGKKDRHPNEKPIDLCLKLIALFSNRGETIFDPFAGSGAVGEAAIRLGRNYVGADQNPDWVFKANERLIAVADNIETLTVTDEAALKLCHMKGSEIG